MATIKIVSNPYLKSNSFYTLEHGSWMEIGPGNHPKVRLLETAIKQGVLAFKAKTILDIIVDEFGSATEMPRIVFEGTDSDFEELESLRERDYHDRITLERSPRRLPEAQEVLSQLVRNMDAATARLDSMESEGDDWAEGLLDQIRLSSTTTLCVLGHADVGKAAFANALIGCDLIPDSPPLLSKTYIRIRRTHDAQLGRMRVSHQDASFSFDFDESGLVEDSALFVKSPADDCGWISELESWLLSMDRYAEEGDTRSVARRLLAQLASILESAFDEAGGYVVVECDIPLDNPDASDSNLDAEMLYVPDDLVELPRQDSRDALAPLRRPSAMLPIFVCDMDDMASDRTMELCKEVSDSTNIDKRFAMIIVNEPQAQDLPNSFSMRFETSVLGRPFPKLLDGQGVFFVSASRALRAMGGERTTGSVTQTPNVGIPKLYRFDIQPDQIKARDVEFANIDQESELVDCGMDTIHREVERYVEHYAPYDICSRIYRGLSIIVEENDKTSKARRSSLEADLNDALKTLEEHEEAVRSEISCTEKHCWEEAKSGYSKYMDEAVDADEWENAVEDFYEAEATVLHEVADRYGLDEQKHAFDERLRAVMQGSRNQDSAPTQEHNAGNAFSAVPKFINDIAGVMQEKGKVDKLQENIRAEVASLLYDQIVFQYLEKAKRAYRHVEDVSKIYWKAKATEAIEKLAQVAKGSKDAMQNDWDQLPRILLANEPYEPEVHDLGHKERFISGIHIGAFNMPTSEDLDLEKLDETFDRQMHWTIKHAISETRRLHGEAFSRWLLSVMDWFMEHLRSLNQDIRADLSSANAINKQLHRISNNQQQLNSALGDAEHAMAWIDR